MEALFLFFYFLNWRSKIPIVTSKLERFSYKHSFSQEILPKPLKVSNAYKIGTKLIKLTTPIKVILSRNPNSQHQGHSMIPSKNTTPT